MQASTPIPADPVTLVDSLSAPAIRGRLAELERQQRALRVLLRAAVARERSADRRPDPREEAARA